MSLYGYSDALSQGSAFNARVQNFNDGIRLQNQKALDEHLQLVKEQAGKVADDALKSKEDGAEYAVMDTKGVLGTGLGIAHAFTGIRESGLAGYVTDSTKGRINTIATTARRAIAKTGSDAVAQARAQLVAGKSAPKPSTFAVSEITQDADGDPVFSTAKSAAEKAAGAAGDAAQAGEEIESSGMGTSIIKSGLKMATRGAIGEAGLSALSEVGGKVLGDFSGGKDIIKSFANLADNKGFFAGESTADKFQEAGAAADLVGTIFPPAELVGGALGLIGGAIDTWDDIKADIDKKTKDAATIPPPKQTAIKVSPAFSTMGLVASAPISAKQSITGS
jgi:hypothetical protein